VGGDPLHVSSSSNGGGEGGGGDKNNFDDHQQQQMKNINASPNLKEALTGIRSSWHGDSAAFPAVNTFGILKMPSNARRSLIQQNSVSIFKDT
jgi:hypothetical protein